MKTIYFVSGIASAAQIALAKSAGAVIRNSDAYHSGDFIEKCDRVMGSVPGGYDEIARHEADAEALKLIEAEEQTGVSDEMKAKISEALEQLDHTNDDHWTNAGKPDMKAVEALVGDSSIKRKDVESVAPDFKRKTDDE